MIPCGKCKKPAINMLDLVAKCKNHYLTNISGRMKGNANPVTHKELRKTTIDLR